VARRKKKDEGGGGGAAWMNTYADMVTLLLCFFVLLYSFSTLDVVKFQALSASLQQAFNIQPGGPTTSTPISIQDGSLRDGAGDAARPTPSDQTDNSKKVLALVQEAIKDEHLEDEIIAEVTERGVVIALSEQLLFEEGSARVLPEARRILFKIGKILNTVPNRISVEGHTDAAQPVQSVYVDNWGLSSARAAAVTSYLNESIDVVADRLRAVGFGSAAPVVPNVSPELSRLNRRVDIVVLSLHSMR
jgi:Flagellar motor protein